MPVDAVPVVPDEHYPGVDAIIQQKNLRASQYTFDNSQFAQPSAVLVPTAMGE